MLETASGFYELKLDIDDSFILLDEMLSPLITLGYGTVRLG